jgi:hypothetical protein
MTAQVIDQFVVRYSMHPWQQRLFLVIGYAPCMDRKQCFLNEVFRLGGHEKTAREKGLEQARQLLQQRPVSRTISIQRQQHKCLQPFFVRIGQITSPIHLHIRKRNG